MNRTRLVCLALILAVLLSSGCATITRGTEDVLVVESDPSGADVSLSNGMAGTTPTSFKLPRKETLVVTITKNGYEPITVNVNPKVSGQGAAGMAGNVVFGGLVGVVVDPISGAMYDLTPNPVSVKLVAIEPVDIEPLDTEYETDEQESADPLAQARSDGDIEVGDEHAVPPVEQKSDSVSEQ